jgi:hypothetical protein
VAGHDLLIEAPDRRLWLSIWLKWFRLSRVLAKASVIVNCRKTRYRR